MKKIAAPLFLAAFALVARENPFLPAASFEEVTTPTNIQQPPPLFEKQSTTLPSQARILQYVVFGYQSVDGDTKEVRMEVGKSVDWHDPLVVAKESLFLPPTVKVTQEPLPQLEEPAQRVTPQPPLAKKVSFKELVHFEVRGREMVVQSKDPILRHFLVANPHKVVLDFKRDTAFYTEVLTLNEGSFVNITMGNHNGHYRAAILLDGHYLYDLEKVEGGVKITLK